MLFIGAAGIVGTIGWSGEVLLLPVACLFPTLWAFAPTRLVAGLVSMAYFMAASRGLPVGVSIFYATDMWLGLVLWVAASLSFVLVHTVLWTSRAGWRKAIRYLIAAILMSVPPFGIVGWASPITAAGVLFPGWGWAGLAASAIGLLVMTMRLWPIASLVLGGALAWSAATWAPPTVPEGWVSINTSFDYEAGTYADYSQQLVTIAMVKEAASNGAKKVVLPESAFGIWTPTTERLWMRGLNDLDDVAVLGGAIIMSDDGYDNVMVGVTARGSEIVYRQRMPVPVSMWRPWSRGAAKAYIFTKPTVDVDGIRIATVICYEQLLIWPILQSMLFSPDVILAVGNGWWTGGANIVAVQKAVSLAWGALFSVHSIIVFNM